MRLGAALALLTPAAASTADACTVCMGDPAAPMAEAANAAIFLMLGCIGGVLALLAAFGIYLYRRSLNPQPPHAQLAEDLDFGTEGGRA
jgi:hypothetical protein